MESVKKSVVVALEPYLKGLDASSYDNSVLNILGAQPVQVEFLTLVAIEEEFRGSDGQGTIVVLLPHSREFKRWHELIAENFHGAVKTFELSASQFWGSDRYANQARILHQRMNALSQLAQGQGFKVVLASFPGLMQATLELSELRKLTIPLKRGDEFDSDELLDRIGDLGYQESDVVTEPGFYSQRGGILDIFTLHQDQPVRIEFIADTLSTMRTFDPVSQRSTGEINECLIPPALELDFHHSNHRAYSQDLHTFLLTNERLDRHERQGMVDALLKGFRFPTLPLFFPLLRRSSGQRSLWDQIEGVPILSHGSWPRHVDDYGSFTKNIRNAFKSDLESGKASYPPEEHFSAPLPEPSQPLIEFGNPFREGPKIWDGQSRTLGPLNLDTSVRLIAETLQEGQRVFVLVQSKSQQQRVSSVFDAHNISWQESKKPVMACLRHVYEDQSVTILRGDLSQPVYLDLHQCLIIPEHAFFGEPKRRAMSTKKSLKAVLSSFRDLKEGSLVVHIEHGIGRYCGMKNISVAGLSSEFLVIEYAGGDRIYLPVDKLEQLQKYSGGSSSSPHLDRLKSQGWTKKKQRVKKAVKDMADELLKIHAQRKTSPGTAFSNPNDLYFQLEADFPYEETDDQLRCIDEVNADLSSAHPMDRLICGDVGFGKTEVAIRAAMRVVIDGFQVMVLAPTTVLSYQHFNTFQKRFEKYGVVVALLNRFVKAKAAKDVIDKFNQGRIDVLVGTHRVLSKDVKARNLGLIVVDEEQRFGVGHKEKLKALKASSDILTLTATPIPRSLHMSLLGLRDISTIMTPPTERLEVKTYVVQWDDSIIKAAIEKEVARGGQVFFVHNRVEDILELRSYLSDLVPGVDIRVGHGQMTEQELERVIVDFLEQKFSVLLCTTIIESGIDMPNVNTILVNRADRFGLSQLYQMRGRVGRSSRQSYAYFLTKAHMMMTPDAEQRLQVLAAHQELGAGFYIANYDLEMRGAGDLLGGAQSGHISDVGIDMYTQLLEDEIRKSQGGPQRFEIDPEIKIDIKASLPPTYIDAESQRLNIYKRIFSSLEIEELEEIKSEVQDRYGPLPADGGAIFQVARLKLMLRTQRAVTLSRVSDSKYELTFGSLEKEHIKRLLKASEKRPDVFKINPDYSMIVTVEALDEAFQGLDGLIYALDMLTKY
ncbi:transcription-repair coupling factor [Pseudobacteriovorax antillogorgiicola]|uniref:Transcription-repair-coupling factor n=1 Tax=Pseudobacteriovorax antillogorgiicola TaxID=1513793 RepID=A0A1Y6B5Q0_9BACT|nr:transcription-repair coupling factor [Pseudobacteriovorax antillogorgiicola]TCS59355.1 transcription-repair coupling factor [Pseudobacteriovorax antillogorgiicola]SME89065.1 transcription-repair coupling factor [Pseudobacteriovorax antillogorgiicola]